MKAPCPNRTHPPSRPRPPSQLEEPDRELAAALTALNEARRRRAMLLGFSQEPANFIDAVMAAQVRGGGGGLLLAGGLWTVLTLIRLRARQP
jgi:hypothetical protein